MDGEIRQCNPSAICRTTPPSIILTPQAMKKRAIVRFLKDFHSSIRENPQLPVEEMKFGRSLVVAAIALATTCAADISTAKPSSTSFTKAPTTSSGSAGCSLACSKIYEPVCGSDGVTYPNDCVLGVAQCESGGLVTQVSDGECPASSSSSASSSRSGCSDVCLDVYDPVTDENGVQYSNECYRRMAQCKAKSGNASTLKDIGASNETESDTSSCDNRMCTMEYAPVCGSNGETYSNSCMLSLAKCKNSSITQLADGECASSERVQ